MSRLISKSLCAVAFGCLASAANAQETPTLTIYTYDAFAADWGPAPALEEGFEAQCNCDVAFVATDSSIGALRRAQLEGAETDADIILGLDTATIGEGKATGLFTEHGVDLPDLDIPLDWSDEVFVPFDYGYFAFVYDSETVENPPASFEELAGMPEDFKIVIQDPRASTPGLGLVLWIKAAYGDDANEAWAELAPHVLTVTNSWSESYDLFLAGEADMVLSYTTSPAYHLIAEDEDRYAAAKFEEGHYTQIEVAGILETSPNKDLARDFLAYLVSPEAQAVIPTTNWMYPVTEPEGGLEPGFEQMIAPDPALLLDSETVTENTRAWIEEAFAALQ
ncbi:thiamine ABC transporter substrate binding subunit [Pelagibacterium xiamenense]|uniref:thiamine ABC transporter substrate binding subunit n=1 Tax=Pelagibacterium xiamenense TaxID=2901140 RepID=UPI001E3F2730|nr:thiamine ABC transporter substrate binding subunit [Pelagibacterium xiamenense]MCD7060427.1 thiamine ABC transporter substrate binding subunit [Pelagibacterium xiamenense]